MVKFTESKTIRKLADSAAEKHSGYLGTLELLEHVLTYHFDENGRANDLATRNTITCPHCWREIK